MERAKRGEKEKTNGEKKGDERGSRRIIWGYTRQERESCIKVCRDACGERVFKIENLIEAAENNPQEIEDIIEVKHLGGSGKAPEESLQERCLLCSVVLQESAFSVFCGACMFSGGEQLFP